MEPLNKIVQRQDAHFKLSKSSSNETSINLSTEISNHLSYESGDITFIIHKDDFIKAIGIICNILPLYNRDNIVESSVDVFGALIQEVNAFFEQKEVAEYRVNHLKRDDNRYYLKNLSVPGFNLRHFLVERHSALLFGEKVDDKIDLRLKTTFLPIDEEMTLGDGSIDTVKDRFIRYMKRTNYHMADHADYVTRFESDLNKILSRNMGREVSIFSFIDIDNLKSTLAEIQQKDDDLAAIMGDYQGTKYASFTVLKQYFTFLEILKDCKDILSQQKPVDDEVRLINESDKTEQIIFYGAPGTGKSYAIETATEGEDVIRTTFHPDSDYSTFVGAYKPTTKEVPVISNFGGKAIKVKDEEGNDIKEERIVYEFVNQAFLQAYVGAWQKLADNTIEPKKQYLVIEEINRGNCAQIFGDLFQLLDRNPQGFSEYPIKADADMKKQLKKQLAGLSIENAAAINALYKNEDVVGKVLDGDILLLPSNLFIWATMNTSDQSLFPIDSAFKRRWDWKYVPIANARKNWAIDANGKKYDWWDFLNKINAFIGETTNSEDKKLGYFFCKTQTGVIDAETFVGKVIFYLWNDVFKDFEFEGDVFVDIDGETKLTFDKFYNSDATVQESTVEVFLTNLGVIYADEVANEEITPEEDDEFIPEETEDNANLTNGNGPDTSTYSINGQGSYGKTNVPIECVRLYASMHPESTIQEIVDVWQNLGVKHVKHLVETEEAHTQRGLETKDDKFKYKAKELILPQGGKVFVSNQFNVERIASFIEKVNAQDWGIYIAKIGGQKETLTNQSNSLKSNSQRFYVTFPDGTTIEERTQFDTYTKALQKIGLDKAESVAAQKRYTRKNCALIDRIQREEILNSTGFSYVTIEGYHIVKNILVDTMRDVINNISQVLNLGVKAVITRV